MAAEAFNSLGGYSVGIPPTPVINPNGNATLNSVTISGQSNLGPVGNVHILGGENGYFLQTDGTGNLTWAAGGGGNGGNGSPGGANSQVQFNDNGNFGGDAGFTYNKVSNVLSVTGNIVSYQFIASGNVIAANANLGNVVVANYFIGNGSLLTGVAKATSADSVANGNSNINIPIINGNATISVNGNPNVVVVTRTGLVSSNLTISGNSTFSNIEVTQKFNTSQAPNVTLGNISNLHILGGDNGYFLQTDGAGNLTWAPAGNGGGGNGTPGGANTQIQYNDSGNFGGSPALTFNETTNTLSITNLTVSNISVANKSNLGPISNVIITGGSSGYYLQTDGNGLLNWTPPSAGAAISNGNSNVNIGVYNGNITAAVNGVDDVLVITETGINVAGNTTSNNITVSENLIANTIQMGNGVYEFYHSSVYFATTVTTDPGQVLWSTPSANLSAIDFTIISTDLANSSRQTAKITAAILGTEVSFNEYSGLYINGGVGTFSVVYQSGSPDTVQLVVTPDSSNMTTYNMMIIQYAN
jgi:hypothetical protein